MFSGIITDEGVRYAKHLARWMCRCGEGTGVDKNGVSAVKWVVATKETVEALKEEYKTHVKAVHAKVA